MISDDTNYALTRSVAIPGESRGTEILRVVQSGKKGLNLNLAARVDGDDKHPLGVTVTAGTTRELTQFDHLQSDVKVFPDLNSPVEVFDRGYLHYERFCSLKKRGEYFVSLLLMDAGSTSWTYSETSRYRRDRDTAHP